MLRINISGLNDELKEAEIIISEKRRQNTFHEREKDGTTQDSTTQDGDTPGSQGATPVPPFIPVQAPFQPMPGTCDGQTAGAPAKSYSYSSSNGSDSTVLPLSRIVLLRR